MAFDAGNEPLEKWAQRRRLKKCNLQAVPPRNGKDWYIASGLCVCEACGNLYVDHPHDEDDEFLTAICNGDRVKL